MSLGYPSTRDSLAESPGYPSTRDSLAESLGYPSTRVTLALGLYFALETRLLGITRLPRTTFTGFQIAFRSHLDHI